MLSETLLIEDDLVLRHKLVTIAQRLSASWRLTHLRHKCFGYLIGDGKVVPVDIDIDTILLSSPTGLSRDIVLLDTRRGTEITTHLGSNLLRGTLALGHINQLDIERKDIVAIILR